MTHLCGCRVVTKTEEQDFSTVSGDWMNASITSVSHPSIATSVDSAVARVCIDSLQYCNRSESCLTATISEASWAEGPTDSEVALLTS